MCLAVPIRITRILGGDEAEGTQLGVTIRFSTAAIEAPRPGDCVLVHAGLAIQTMDEDEAQAALDVWRRLQAQTPDGG